MRIDVVTIFPEMFDSFLATSLIARGIKKKIININLFDLRSVATDRHKSVDGRPYGGGPGMVLRIDIIDRAIKKILSNSKISRNNTKFVLLTPQGVVFNQLMSNDLSTVDHLVFICGHYEGFDERIRELVDLEISLGDYILTGGELPAMVIIDSLARNIKGFLGKEISLNEESFSLKSKILNLKSGLLEYPQYTRPESFNHKKVPKILLSGNHEKIRIWRDETALDKTKKNRPDLLS